MPLINCKIHLELNWSKDCVLHGANAYNGGNNADDRETTFKITCTKLHVPIVTLSTKDNINLPKQLNEGFKRTVYWNEYKSKIKTKEANDNKLSRFYFNVSFQGVKKLFVLAFNTTTADVANNPINNTAIRILRHTHGKYFFT